MCRVPNYKEVPTVGLTEAMTIPIGYWCMTLELIWIFFVDFYVCLHVNYIEKLTLQKTIIDIVPPEMTGTAWKYIFWSRKKNNTKRYRTRLS